MPIEILMPALSPTMEEGNLAKWVKKEGDSVAAGDVIAEIETDKATMEVEAVDEGVLGRILVAEGTEGVKVNTPIALLLAEGEDESALDEAASGGGGSDASESSGGSGKPAGDGGEEGGDPVSDMEARRVPGEGKVHPEPKKPDAEYRYVFPMVPAPSRPCPHFLKGPVTVPGRGPVPAAPLIARWQAMLDTLKHHKRRAKCLARTIQRWKADGEARPYVAPIPRTHAMPAPLGIVSGGLTVQLIAALRDWPPADTS